MAAAGDAARQRRSAARTVAVPRPALGMDAGGGVVVATDPIHRARLTPAAGAERWSPLNPAAAFAGRGESPAPAARATRVQFRDACAARRVAMADAPSAPAATGPPSAGTITALSSTSSVVNVRTRRRLSDGRRGRAPADRRGQQVRVRDRPRPARGTDALALQVINSPSRLPTHR